jgi:uncharacterized protein YndB with AHSA1/START domain
MVEAHLWKGKPQEEDLTITHIFDAPREIVWAIWTEPELVRRWWGPEGFTVPVARIDLRVGGRYLYCMMSPDCEDLWSTGVYREIVPMERIVVTDSFADEMGNIVPAAHYGMSGMWPDELLVTATFEEEQDGKTKFTLVHSGIPFGEPREQAEAGWNESFEKFDRILEETVTRTGKTLIAALPGKQDALMIRFFDAPRDRVFKASTDPKLIPHWWAPRRFTVTVDKSATGPGGFWRYINRDAQGNEFAFHGVYHEITPPARLVYTFEFEGMPGHVLLGIVTFEEKGGRTKVTERSIFESVADRDGMLEAGMREGGSESMDRLAELVEKK